MKVGTLLTCFGFEYPLVNRSCHQLISVDKDCFVGIRRFSSHPDLKKANAIVDNNQRLTTCCHLNRFPSPETQIKWVRFIFPLVCCAFIFTQRGEREREYHNNSESIDAGRLGSKTLQSTPSGSTGVMVFGRIDNQTKPVNKLVTAKPSASRSALDCELRITNPTKWANHTNSPTEPELRDYYLLASATGAIPETARLKRTAKREAPPT